VAAAATKARQANGFDALGACLSTDLAPALTRARGTFRTLTGRAAPVTAARHIGCLGLDAGTATRAGRRLEEELRHDRNQYGTESI